MSAKLLFENVRDFIHSLCMKAEVFLTEYLSIHARLEQATEVHKMSTGIVLYSFFNLCPRWGGWITSRPGRLTAGKDPVPIV